MNAPTSMCWLLMVQPSPAPAFPPPAIALTSGLMMLSVKALTRVLNASATTRPTAMTTRSPCIRKFLKPFSTSPPRWVRVRGQRRPQQLPSIGEIIPVITALGARHSARRQTYHGSALGKHPQIGRDHDADP